LYLEHIKLAWNRRQKGDADCFLENQLLVITVPASFDQVARDLTLEAARQAGLERVTLLEEPLAAFYSWLRSHDKTWADQVQPDELILICDVGGGTTDLTLITLKASEGTPRFERIAVGDHLILGGDNIDLALARFLEHREGRQKLNLDGDRWKTLCHQCRQAKEQILEGKTDQVAITVMGRGRKLIGGTISIQLAQKEMEAVVLDGFFPRVAAEGPRSTKERTGITEFGLPYEPEPAITKQIGWFLEKHRNDIESHCGGRFRAPDWILFNGGSLKPSSIQKRIQSAVGHWFQLDPDNPPGILPNPHPELAVAMGAAYYGLVKMGRGVRVGSGSPRAYF
jgi:molecular chaperone DnaK (HSP70)